MKDLMSVDTSVGPKPTGTDILAEVPKAIDLVAQAIMKLTKYKKSLDRGDLDKCLEDIYNCLKLISTDDSLANKILDDDIKIPLLHDAIQKLGYALVNLSIYLEDQTKGLELMINGQLEYVSEYISNAVLYCDVARAQFSHPKRSGDAIM